MYCKSCGHRAEGQATTCPKCGVKLTSALVIGPPTQRRFRWNVLIAAAVAGLIAFVVLPRIFLRTELDPLGPTDKLRFLRALEHTQYRRAGQRAFRVEDQTLIIIWDLRWNTLPESKQREIVGIVGRAWKVVGGQDTRFRLEATDESVATYIKDQVRLQND